MILFSHHSIIPVRAEASDASEMVTQLLFGELAHLIKQEKQWMKIRILEDSYEGWIDEKMVAIVAEDWANRCTSWQYVVSPYVKATRIINGMNSPIALTLGCRFPTPLLKESNGSLLLQAGNTQIEVHSKDLKGSTTKGHEVLTNGLLYEGAPYLWGGKTTWGIDCSGLSQMACRMAGIAIPRDASQQVKEGKEVAFENREAGDLAFFINAKGNIHHVGIITETGDVLHASGRVRHDKLTPKGIVHTENQHLTHNFFTIKRYT